MSAPRPAQTGLTGWEEVETDPSQAVTTQVVRAIGRWGSLRGSEYPKETLYPAKEARRMGSLVRRLSKGKGLRGRSRQAAPVKGPQASKLV